MDYDVLFIIMLLYLISLIVTGLVNLFLPRTMKIKNAF